MKFKSILAIVVISAATAFVSVWGYGTYVRHEYAGTQEAGKLPVNYAGFFDKNNAPVGAVDFTPAATSATPAVVHIKTRTKARQISNNLPRRRGNGGGWGDLFGDGDDDPFSQFFGGSPRSFSQPEQRASGSGVLISQDGYIVTNNHVVADADEINVTLSNRKSYKGTVVGTDPNTDLAVIKIDGNTFPYMVYGNSDDVRLGQWVLAVGYPLTLDVTVTAGIISAKARSIGINKAERPIESYLQTDAAVNPGNSGGALINTNGELIGINSAIASPTGSYAGYSYAIPVNIVKKVVNDMIKFGTVQRAFIGISYAPEDLSDEQRKANNIKDGDGVYVTGVEPTGAAGSAGIAAGDFITKINGVDIQTGPELQEQVTRYKPGDKITVTYIRNGHPNTVNLTLKNSSGTYAAVKTLSAMDKLGMTMANLDKATAQKNNVPGGVVVQKIDKTGAQQGSRMQEGFVITSVNGVDVRNMEEFQAAVRNAGSGQIRVDGFYPGYEGTYEYPLNLEKPQQQNGDHY